MNSEVSLKNRFVRIEHPTRERVNDRKKRKRMIEVYKYVKYKKNKCSINNLLSETLTRPIE